VALDIVFDCSFRLNGPFEIVDLLKDAVASTWTSIFDDVGNLLEALIMNFNIDTIVIITWT